VALQLESTRNCPAGAVHSAANGNQQVRVDFVHSQLPRPDKQVNPAEHVFGGGRKPSVLDPNEDPTPTISKPARHQAEIQPDLGSLHFGHPDLWSTNLDFHSRGASR
jgi:hypothetical protein